MRAPFAQTWAVKKHAPRRAAPRVFQAPVPESDSDSDDDTPEVGAVAFGTVKKGEAIKDGSKRSKFGAALKVVLAVFSLLRSTAKNPLLPYARGRPGKYYHKSHRNELSAGVSRYLADAFFAACSGLELPPLAQYSAKLDNSSAQQAERATLERQLYHDEARGGTCYITAVTRAFPCAPRAGPRRPTPRGLGREQRAQAVRPARRALCAAQTTAATRRACLHYGIRAAPASARASARAFTKVEGAYTRAHACAHALLALRVLSAASGATATRPACLRSAARPPAPRTGCCAQH